nr:protection of telomeres protein 1 [Quercus suber]
MDDGGALEVGRDCGLRLKMAFEFTGRVRGPSVDLLPGCEYTARWLTPLSTHVPTQLSTEDYLKCGPKNQTGSHRECSQSYSARADLKMEHLTPPEGFCDLLTAFQSKKDTILNLIGVVVDYMPPMTARSGEFMLTVKLLDLKLRDNTSSKSGFPLRFFAAKQEWLPPIHSIGDVLLVIRVKSIPFNGSPMALSNKYETRWLVFANNQIPDPAFILSVSGNNRLPSLARPDQVQHEPTLSEQKYVIDLKKGLSMETDELLASNSTKKRELYDMTDVPTGPRSAKKAKLSNFGSKFQLVKQLRTGTFADLCVMVVKKFHVDPGRRTELYVTDYTENDRMFYYSPPEELGDQEREGDHYGYSDGSKRSWKGPFGHMVLKVNTRHPHSTYANLWGEENTILVLRNVKLKAMNEFSNLEGDMWPDDRNQGKNNVRRLQPDERDWHEVHELLERKEKYEQRRAREEKKHGLATHDANTVTSEHQNTKSSKKSAKARRKERKKEKEKKRGQQQKHGSIGDGEPNGTPPRNAGMRDQAIVSATSGARPNLRAASNKVDPLWQLNQNIRANHTHVQTTAVKDVLDYHGLNHFMKDYRGVSIVIPFSNIRTRVLVRVVDFSPSLERFAILRPSETGDEHNQSLDKREDSDYQWRFRLQLEDAGVDVDGKPVRGPDGKPVRFIVEVFHQEAQYLLGNSTPDPVDLTKNPKLLAQLREKMCILWGNLEEWKSSNWTLRGGLKNKPFVCCIAEYGVRCEDGGSSDRFGMKKCFKLTDTTIMFG